MKVHGNISAARPIAAALCCSKIRDLMIKHDLKRHSSRMQNQEQGANVKPSIEIENKRPFSASYFVGPIRLHSVQCNLIGHCEVLKLWEETTARRCLAQHRYTCIHVHPPLNPFHMDLSESRSNSDLTLELTRMRMGLTRIAFTWIRLYIAVKNGASFRDFASASCSVFQNTVLLSSTC